MPTTELASEAVGTDLARECLYRFLAAALTSPDAESWRLVFDTRSQRLARDAADLLRTEARTQAVPLGFGELPSDQLHLDTLLVEIRKSENELRAEYDHVFGLVLARECPPYETEYHPASETFFRCQQLADVAGFYRGFP